MTGKNCPFCGAEIEPGKARDKAVCPSCGREFDYNTLNAEARGIIDGKRWAREDEERKGAVAIRRKRAAAAASLDVENETLIQTAISRLIKDKPCSSSCTECAPSTAPTRLSCSRTA